MIAFLLLHFLNTTIRDACVKSGVPFFFEQWGGVRKKEKGRVLEDRVWDEMPV